MGKKKGEGTWGLLAHTIRDERVAGCSGRLPCDTQVENPWVKGSVSEGAGEGMKRLKPVFRGTGMCLAVVVLLIVACACIKPKITLFPDGGDPLDESVLEGKGRGKVAVINISGFISDAPRIMPFQSRPSMLQDVAAQLKKAEEDDDVKAIVLKVDSPGGSITASDMLYQEILNHKRRTGHKVVAAMMNVAASGGYYISLSADYLLAHPTTITGSIGVIFVRPKVTGLMGKIGLEVEVSKSGENKDMGSPFRRTSREEEAILQGMIDQMGLRFLMLVARHRGLDEKSLSEIALARIYLAGEALRLGLIDEVGYLEDALSQARKMAGLPKDAKVIAYRRTKYPNDNIYNPTTQMPEGAGVSLLGVNLPEHLFPPRGGLYYLWLPGSSTQ